MSDATDDLEDGVANQIRQVWTGMLQQFTQGGASRAEIVTVAARTAETILGVTGDNLWPEGTVPPAGEGVPSDTFRTVAGVLADFRAAWKPMEGTATDDVAGLPPGGIAGGVLDGSYDPGGDDPA